MNKIRAVKIAMKGYFITINMAERVSRFVKHRQRFFV